MCFTIIENILHILFYVEYTILPSWKKKTHDDDDETFIIITIFFLLKGHKKSISFKHAVATAQFFIRPNFVANGK